MATAGSQGIRGDIVASGGGGAVEGEIATNKQARGTIWTRSRRAREGCALDCEDDDDMAGWRKRCRGVTSVVLPEEVVVWEILVRLPAKALLRCRAVCRSWYKLTSARDFLVAHHKHQPSLPLINFSKMRDGYVVTSKSRDRQATLHACDLRRARRPERRAVVWLTPREEMCLPAEYSLHASCDGLLLVSLGFHCYYICNPATRECASLGTRLSNATAMYLHLPSGEYRVLYWKKTGGNAAVYCILTLGSSQEPRCIGLPVASTCSMEKVLIDGIKIDFPHHYGHSPLPVPVLLHNCLHWHPGSWSHADAADKLVVFDTVLESFRWMASPNPTTNPTRTTSLLEMEGVLGISYLDASDGMLEVWLLNDYGSETWILKSRIQLPTVEMSYTKIDVRVMSLNRDMLVCYSDGYSATCSILLHCDTNGELLKEFRWITLQPTITRHWFKESLIRHAFFEGQGDVTESIPCFFQGL